MGKKCRASGRPGSRREKKKRPRAEKVGVKTGKGKPEPAPLLEAPPEKKTCRRGGRQKKVRGGEDGG